jgi:ribosomal protein S18 acetylase RimI-like enzyme
MARKKVKKISFNKYLIKIIVDDKVAGKLLAIADTKLDFQILQVKLDKKFWIIEEIEITPEFLGNGLGTELLTFAIKYLCSRQKLPLLVVPPKSEYTEKLINWYKRFGFTETQKGYLIHPGN